MSESKNEIRFFGPWKHETLPSSMIYDGEVMVIGKRMILLDHLGYEVGVIEMPVVGD